jgi:hypothetical protein
LFDGYFKHGVRVGRDPGSENHFRSVALAKRLTQRERPSRLNSPAR